MAQFRQQSGSDRFSSSSPHDHVSIRIPTKQPNPTRIRRHVRPDKPPNRRVSAVAIFTLTLVLALCLTLFAFHRLLSDAPNPKGTSEEDGSPVDWHRNQTKELQFGHGLGSGGRDSRGWDRDDRRRDQDYEERDAVGHGVEKKKVEVITENKEGGQSSGSDGGLYNEGGRSELDSYKDEDEEEYAGRRDEEVDEYDDGIDVQDEHKEEEEEEHNVGDGEGRRLGGDGGSEEEQHREDVKGNVRANGGSTEVSTKGSGSKHKGGKSLGSGKTSKLKKKPKRHRTSSKSLLQAAVCNIGLFILLLSTSLVEFMLQFSLRYITILG